MTPIEYLKSNQMIIQKLYLKYQNNDIMIEKLNNCIKNLETMLDNYEKTHKENQAHKENMKNIQSNFTSEFLANNKFFYSQQTNLFFSYNGENFNVVNEDEVVMSIFNFMKNYDNTIQKWKYRIKNHVVKCIKEEQNILDALPESCTIQKVFKMLVSTIFDNKEQAKYFLCVLGDIILKKNKNNIIVPGYSKSYIEGINYHFNKIFHNAIFTNHFKFRYHEHKYEESLLLNFNRAIENIEYLTFTVNKNLINMFVLASHYSKRYANADNFLNGLDDESELKAYALYLKKNSEQTIVNRFCENYIEESNSCNISNENILYLWKEYMTETRLPNVVFSTRVIDLCIEKFTTKYDSDKNIFVGLTSSKLPRINRFFNFWNLDVEEEEDYIHYEIEEIRDIYNATCTKNLKLTSDTLLGVLKHYKPDVIIEEDKYIYGINLKLWNKRKDIETGINNYLTHCILNNITTNQSIDKVYEHYCLNKNNIQCVGKKSFESYFSAQYSNYIENGLIKISLLME